MHSFTNRLIDETSPYLLQHAHNPVNWYPWGEEALQLAKKENKPILVSIGYAACHWCHVMERESFEDETTAAIMNQHFINIKIDREERPDLDHMYMDAVQAITGSGGWPLNVFLTPDTKPFYGGTYFPPQRAFNRPSWQETLYGVIQAFREKRHEIDAQAENLTEHLQQSNLFGMQPHNGEAALMETAGTGEMATTLLKQADTVWGGFGRAPKFPQTFSIQFLLRNYHITKRSDALQQALLSLDKMAEGGIYDHLGGGFARYSTDNEWLAPHFEKMLYDNALLVSVFSEAYQLTGKEMYREIIDQTIAFVQRELMHTNNGFYAALDADSEGKEGKFYVWSAEEIKKIPGADADLFCEYYDVSEKGNWEETNILRIKTSLNDFAAAKNITAEKLQQLLSGAKEKLLAERNKRVRPLTDDKIILGWNALMNAACSKAFAATGNEAYRQLAIGNMNFLLTAFKGNDSPALYHTWKNNAAKYPAFLDDYAYLIQALLHLQEITADTSWLEKAGQFAGFVIDQFGDTESPFFFYTQSGQQDIIVRKKEVYDGAVPSGNAVMASNLYHLAILLDKKEWRKRSEAMVQSLNNAIVKYPTSFGCWACLLQEMIAGTNEIAIIGTDYISLHRELMRKYIPHKVIMAVEKPSKKYPLLADKEAVQRTSVFCCRNYTCQLPVFSVEDLMSLINRPPEH